MTKPASPPRAAPSSPRSHGDAAKFHLQQYAQAYVNDELKRRARVAAIFPNEASFLRPVSALLAETFDDWESSKIYLNMNPSPAFRLTTY